MMTRGKKENLYSPRSRKPIHFYKMDTSDAAQSSSHQRHQNVKYGREQEVPLEEPPECRNNGDNGNIQKVVIKDVSDTESEQEYHTVQECAQSSSKYVFRKEEPRKAGIHAYIMYKWTILLSCTVVIVGICVYLYNSCGAQEYAEEYNSCGAQEYAEKHLRMDIQHIHNQFPSQLNTTWIAFLAGIKDVQRTPAKPSVFVLLYETEGETPACLAWKIGNISAHFLSAKNKNPIVLDGANLEKNQTLGEDYGILMEEYRPMVEERRTMIVKDLHKVSANVAQSFYCFCDTVTPLVDKAVFLFTMKASGVIHAQDNPTSLAVKELRKLWNGQIDRDQLMPLIVRITDSVLVIMPEKHHMSCPEGAIVPEREHL
ncbi:uncharacterized protein LOC111867008 isoform X2 [Cryptotermes secundus]|nr:uncharacterized protein LOC111867008 isoform X2 [Cryptotermes secundus]XP_023712228.1 uncharacterized protein LOC111867008 isoform X2 [Cryptotermes secundus]